MNERLAVVSALFATIAVSAVAAQTRFEPGVLYDIGGKFDKSRNEGVAVGVALYAGKTGVEFREFEVTNETQREQALRNMARRGNDPILAAGPAQAPAVERVAGEFPATRFAILDGVVEAPNVQSIVFRDEEGAFLVGALAAISTRSGKIGFIGGMDTPRVRRIACGYRQGAKYVRSEIEILENMAGTTPAAWNNPIKGAELAKGQFDRGVDIAFHTAGGTGLGVLQAAADSGKLAIGSEFNQNGLHPGSVLTSMVRRVDLATYNMFRSAARRGWRPGILSLGIKERGVDWAFDENNAPLVSAQARQTMERIKAAISSGRITIADYAESGSCPS